MLKNTVISILLLSAIFIVSAKSQDSRFTDNFGGGASVPLNPTAHYAGVGGHFVAGAGYNFDQYNSLIGQFMWSGLPPTVGALSASQGLSKSSNLYTATANYRFRLEGQRLGAYVIAGGGLYYRHSSLHREVQQPNTVCTYYWLWWGYSCTSGYVSTDQTLASSGLSAFGGNAGIGFTVKIADSGEKLYVETRYHYAPHKNIQTQLLLLTFGFTF